MNIKISDIKDYGNLEKERVILKVLADTDLGKYIVSLTSEMPDDKISAKIKHVLWLPDQELKSGDMVVIYTKSGQKDKHLNDDGTTTYFFYWGQSAPLTSLDDSGIVLFETSWTYRKVVPEQNDVEAAMKGQNQSAGQQQEQADEQLVEHPSEQLVEL